MLERTYWKFCIGNIIGNSEITIFCITYRVCFSITPEVFSLNSFYIRREEFIIPIIIIPRFYTLDFCFKTCFFSFKSANLSTDLSWFILGRIAFLIQQFFEHLVLRFTIDLLCIFEIEVYFRISKFLE